MSARRGVSLVTVALAAALASPARAADPPAKLDAETCASTAERAADERDSGRLRDAARSFAVCARDECPRIVREDCRRGLGAISENGPHLAPRVRDASGADVLDAEVLLDGVPVEAEARARGVLVDPGPHVLTARRAGVLAGRATILVAAGDRLRTVDVTLDAPVEVERPPSHTPSWVAFGVAGAFLAAGGGLGTWTYLDYRALDRECRPTCSDDRIDPVHTRAIVADVALGVGAAALVTAVVLRVTERRSAPRSGPDVAVLSW